MIIVFKIFKRKAPIKKPTTNLDFRKSLIKGEIWILVPHFGNWTSHLVTNAVIRSQPSSKSLTLLLTLFYTLFLKNWYLDKFDLTTSST